MNSANSNEHHYKTLGEMFFYSLKFYKNRIFQYLDDTNETSTYSEILQWSTRTAIKLRQKGITQYDIISTCTYNRKYSPIPTIVAQFIGAISSNFDPNLSHLDTIYLLNLIRPKLLFVDEKSVEFMEKCLQEANIYTELVVFGRSNKYTQFERYLEPSEEEKHFEPVNIEDNTLTAAIFFSSGTTGFPKGICLSHRALLKVINNNKFFESVSNETTVILMYTTLYWISAAFSLIMSINSGYSCVIRINFDPAYTWKLIEKYKVSTMFLAPYHAVEFLKHRPEKCDIDSLKTFLTGSSLVPKKLMHDLKESLPNTKILNGYGQTETVGVMLLFDVNDPEEYRLQQQKPQSCGKMVDGMKWKVVDVNTEKKLGPNQKGELRVKNDGYIFNGYYKTDSSSAFDEEGYLKTGDIFYYDEDECFYFVERIKEIFKYKGWHILPAILEEILMLHPAVKEGVVIGVSHEIDGDHPMAVVVLNEGYSIGCAKEIETFVNEKVADCQKLRAGVKIIDSFPKTPTNKINRRELKNIILNK